MLRKLLKWTTAALVLMLGTAPCLAELTIENTPPKEPIEVESEFMHVTARYDAQADQSLYTAVLKGNSTFADGSPITAQDLLFTLYAYLDPGCTLDVKLAAQPILGLESYLQQVTGEHLLDARAVLEGIKAAGRDHQWSESDGWTSEQQETYWALQDEYRAACEAEFPHCAQAIVDYNISRLGDDGAFGFTAEEIRADQGLQIAFAMERWGYATYSGETLTSKRAHIVWKLSDGKRPTLEEFVYELSLPYDGDLAWCWSVETPGNYAPVLPDPDAQFIDALLAAVHDELLSIEGIRLADEQTVEVALDGVIDLYEVETLFGEPILSLNRYGDAELWKPDEGQFGHPFGDVARALEGYADGPRLIQQEHAGF